jgi:hypothetical protein
MSSVNQMFGLASAVAWHRCGGVGTASQYVIASLAKGFGGNTGDGDYVYGLLAADTGVFSSSGFDGSSVYYNSVELNVPNLNGYSRLGAAAIIYSYANFPNISEDTVLSYINSYCETAKVFFSESPVTFTSQDLEDSLSSFSLSVVNDSLSQIPSTKIEKAINYNWYDAEPLFVNPNINGMTQLIKDSENQYYYISGEVLYQSQGATLGNCVEYTQTVTTPTGDLTFNVVANSPCYSESSYTGPVSGIKFFRIFNDGPGSSGHFDSGTMDAYIEFDKTFLDKKDYSSNSVVLYSNERNSTGYYVYLKSGMPIDAPGFFDSSNEYGVGHTNFIDEGCTNHPEWPMMRMHQGDNQLKWWCVSYLAGTYPNQTCEYYSVQYDWTGWKLVPFELKESLAKRFENLELNPEMDTGRLLKRILSLSHPYAYTSASGTQLTCTGIFGPPQLAGNYPTLPSFAFYQTFDNVNFPDFPSITVRAAILSGGSYVVSENDLFTASGESHTPLFNPAQVPFFVTISSTGITGYDDTTKRCLAIGDNFGSGVSGGSSPQSNAGYSYVGYSYYLNGNLISQYDLLNSYSKKIAHEYDTIRYVSGYQSGSQKYGLVNHYSFVSTGSSAEPTLSLGETLDYQYLANGVLGATNSGWNIFAPEPSVVSSNPGTYQKLFKEQRVENYLPRYANGPFATYKNKFLYPNAQEAYTKYRADVEGFPRKIFYEMSFKEEFAREIYAYVNRYGDKEYNKVIRATGNYDTGALKSSMFRPFAPDNLLYEPNYSFRNTGLYPENTQFDYDGYLAQDHVDENFVFDFNYATGSSDLNKTIYRYGSTFWYPPSSYPSLWNNGIKKNYALLRRTLFTGKNGASGEVLSKVPVSEGLRWGYFSMTWTGAMDYVLPAFNLDTKQIEIDEGFSGKIQELTNKYSAYCFYTHQTPTFDGSRFGRLNGDTYLISGQDPLFYENIGGRIGEGAELEGGNHSYGIVGDAWYDCFGDRWGTIEGNTVCTYSPSTHFYSYRCANNDSHLFLMEWKPSGWEIYTRGLSYYPYYYSYSYQPFTSNIGGVGINNLIPKRIGNELFFDFEFSTYFPLITATGNGFYSNDGWDIGPFDRDVELCVSSGRSVLVKGELYINDERITIESGAEDMLMFDMTNLAPNSGIFPGVNGRSPVITTFKVLPKNTIVNINISGTSGNQMGIVSPALVTIRPRLVDGDTYLLDKDGYESFYDRFGDGGYLDAFRHIRNHSESKFSLPFSNINDLVNTPFVFTTKSKEKVLYPKPDVWDFHTYVPTGIDEYGNVVYPANPTKVYWENKTPDAYFPVVRETTRVEFFPKRIFVSGVGQIPYQSLETVIPNGECYISGVFGYTGQADAAIISDGIFLSGKSGASSLSGIFEPNYVSEVMQRLPSGVFLLPSGSGHKPILPAPTLMKQRKNVFYITGNDKYVSISPEGSNYNAFLWPAWSDLGLLNPEVVYEQMPPEENNVFLDSYLTFSAAQGQQLASGFNPVENVTYEVKAQYGFIDSVATNAIYNTGKCIFSGWADKTILNSGDLSGILTSEGNSLTMAVNLKNFKV